jgi:hypothetical protein
MLRLNRRNLGVTIGAAILLGLAGFSMNLFGNNLGVYDEFRVSGHLNNPHQIPDRLNPRMISANERADQNYSVEESSTGSIQALHGMAFKRSVAYAKPILDYTTGTSN